jgi:predicted ester cyclase
MSPESSSPESSSPETENKSLVRRFYTELDAGNVDAMDDLVAEDYVDHNPPPFPGLASGRAGLKQAFGIFWDATPGRHEIEDQVAEGDKVVTRLTAYGRHDGELPGGLAATGRDMVQTAVSIHRVQDGRLVEHWSARDDLGLLVQLGVISMPSG